MALGQRHAPRRLGGQPRPQPFDAVARVVQGVAARQQLAGFREQRHHQAHRHPAGGAVDVRRGDVRAAFLQRLAMPLNENLHRLAHPFAQHFGELRLALAGVADALQQRRGGVLRRRPQLGLQQSTQRRHLRRQRALREPRLRIPLAGGVEVHAREQQAPVATVGEQRQVFPASAQIGQRLANGATASANAEPHGIVQEYRQASASRPSPQVPRLHRLAGDDSPAFGRRNMAAPLPDAGGRIEAAYLFEHEGHEAGDFGTIGLCAVEQRGGAAAQLVLRVVAERRWGVASEFGEAGGVEEQAAVAQVLPAGQAVVRRWFGARGVGIRRQTGLPASRLSVVSIVLACTRVGQTTVCAGRKLAEGAARSAADLWANEWAGTATSPSAGLSSLRESR